MATEQDKLFCRMAMKMELLTREQSLDALAEVDAKAKLGVEMRIVDLLRARGELTTDECREVLGALKDRAERKASEAQAAGAAGLPTASPAEPAARTTGSGSRKAPTRQSGPAGGGVRSSGPPGGGVRSSGPPGGGVRRRPSSKDMPTASPADSAGATQARGDDAPVVPAPPPHGVIAPGAVMGKYTLTRKLGEGAMGVVYEAVQSGMSRRAAIKVLAQALVANQRAVQRFQREAEAAARLSHPGIVAIFGMGEQYGAHFIAMEFVDGHTIEELIEKETLPWKRIAEIVASAAEALDYAHERGVIHRDIKPANLMITNEDERVLIADFGLARPEGASQITGAGQLLGTPAYMAPEQASGDRGAIDRRTDVYSLGASFYEMLTLQRPFPGKAVFEVLQKVLEEEPEDPCAVNPSVPRELADVCLKAMAKIVDHRYQAARELAEDLRVYLRGGTPNASGAGKVRRGKGGGGFLGRLTGRKRR
jgi:predicted Ser/Thr protein kinase